jgi:hypothetical protein
MLRRKFLQTALFLPLAALTGCAGYQLGPVKPKRLEAINTIAVHSVRNQTLEPRLEILLANTIIKQFQQDGTFKVVREKDADAILETDLEQMIRRPARLQTGNVLLAKEYTLTLRCRYKLTKRGTGELLDSRVITGDTSFFATGSSLIQADVNQDERQAIPLAAENLAVRMVAVIAEGW